MTFDEIIRELESLGTEQNRKIYQRHGAGPNLFGVSFANIDKIAKKLKKNQPIADKLWATGNLDAQTLALKIADPASFDEAKCEEWLHQCKYQVLTDYLVANVVSNTPFRDKKREEWRASPDEWIGRAGWMLVNMDAMYKPELSDSGFVPYLNEIERTIHTQPNHKKEMMNATLIAIGIRSEVMEQAAIATAKRIGKVEIDHGDTSCKTPDAVAYIQKARERNSDRGAPKKKTRKC